MVLSTAFMNWTPVAVADTTAMTDSGHHTIQNGAASNSQRNVLLEVFLSGLAASSAPALLVLGRTSTNGGTLTGGRMAPADANSTLIANPPTSYQVSTTKPQRSATLGMLLNLAFNAFGGVIRWYKGPEQFISTLGATQPYAELSLNAFTGGTPGAISSAIIIDSI